MYIIIQSNQNWTYVARSAVNGEIVRLSMVNHDSHLSNKLVLAQFLALRRAFLECLLQIKTIEAVDSNNDTSNKLVLAQFLPGNTLSFLKCLRCEKLYTNYKVRSTYIDLVGKFSIPRRSVTDSALRQSVES